MALISFFNRFFAGSSPEQEQGLNWKHLTDVSQLEDIISLSATRRVLLFKHSTRCGISSMVLRQFEQGFSPDEHTDLHFIDLLRYRDVSNAVAERFNIIHQSPQVLVIENGSCVLHASHHQILEMSLG
ncbi:MAG: bacillithiol system redox-active protein YtxJ [Cryomorphaceae bacterium]|nr:MAG: bacillithiol system redox-active protein YtxJ [Cryomorphaceae bacterium]